MKRSIQSLLVICALITPPLHAASVEDLYTGVVPVSDSSDGERKRAMGKALEQVLVKLTGKSNIAAYPEVGTFLSRASSYALELGYVELQNQEGQGLSVTFTENSIDDFLRRQQLPIWPRRRAPLLVWVLKEAPDQPMGFVARDNDEGLYQRLDSLFDVRGMPVLYPLYDLEDQLSLSAREAWEFNVDQLTTASTRYGADRWLVIRCFQTSAGNWRLAWILGGGEQPSLSSIDAQTLEEALAPVVEMAVDQVATDYAYIPSLDAKSLVIDVSGIENYASYIKLTELISGLSMIKSYSLQRVSKHVVSVNLELEGDQQLFVEALSLYDQLGLSNQPTAGSRLALDWQSDSAFP